MTEEIIDTEQLVRLGVKLAGLAVLIYAALNIHYLLFGIYTYLGDKNLLKFLAITGYALIYIGIGLFLWMFPKSISNRVVSKTGGNQDDQASWSHRTEIIGMSLMGVFLLFNGISDLVYNYILMRHEKEQLGSVYEAGSYMPEMIATGVEIVFAVVLILTPRGIVKALRLLRSAGT